jgi:hypothetical protein
MLHYNYIIKINKVLSHFKSSRVYIEYKYDTDMDRYCNIENKIDCIYCL